MSANGSFYAQVGDRVRRRRQERGLTQDALAHAVRLTRTSIANIERGRQRLLLHTFAAIAHVLNIEPARLLPAVDKDHEAARSDSAPDDLACG